MSKAANQPALPLDLVKPLCASFAKQADWLLKLFEMTQGKTSHPGQCVSCFYALLGAAKGDRRATLEPLRGWIEEHLEIYIQAGDEPAGSLPLVLLEEDMESFCASAVERIREDSLIEHPQVTLQIRFKQGAAA